MPAPPKCRGLVGVIVKVSGDPRVMAVRTGVDIGGTFTDLVLVDDRSGQVTIEKGLTTYPGSVRGPIFA